MKEARKTGGGPPAGVVATPAGGAGVPPSERPPDLPSWPRLLAGVLLGLAVAAVVIYLLSPHLVSQLQHARLATHRPALLGTAFLCVLVYMAADAETLVTLVRILNPCAARRSAWLVTLRGTAVGGATSFGGLEMPYQVVALRRQVAGLTQATAVVLVKMVLRTSLLVLVALAGLAPGAGAAISATHRWIVLGALGLVLAGWLIGWLWVRRPVGLGRLPARLRERAHGLRDAFAQFHSAGGRAVAFISLLQLVYWAAMFAVIPLCLLALGWRGPLLPVITGQAMLQVIMPISPLPGGAGVAELGFLAIIGHDMPVGVAVTSLILWRAATWALPVVLGAASFGVRERPPARSA